MTRRIQLGISTCPNDTFTFHALMNRLVDWRGLEFDIELLDIQQLNDRLFRGDFDVAKVSFHASLRLAHETVVLPSGSALGFGVGPLLLAARTGERPSSADQITLCPGRDTTAALLFQLFYPQTTQIRHGVFSDIMPQLRQQQVDFGVCIHEGRFTWQDQGLHLVEDLGIRWESETGGPLPLGGIIARTNLDSDIIANVQAVIRDSLTLALAAPAAALPTMRQYAQEFNDDVLQQHVDLYVNDWTVELGDVGRKALAELSSRASQIGLVPENSAGLRVWAS
ncbi:MAG: 1,4-dihydroxy-6-naphthoate synthase [Fuerstiella sp.]